LEAVDEIDHGAPDVGKARTIDEETDTLVLEHAVAVTLLVERQGVLKARASSAAHADPQPGGLGYGRLAGQKLTDLLGTFVGHGNHCFMKYSEVAGPLRLGL
jgi:hypothetical protein